MRRRTSLVNLNQISDINMTPLMDLTFILLITFIITFPLIEQGIAINLPKGKSSTLTESISRSITLNSRGSFYLDNQQISSEDLLKKINDIGRSQPDITIFVRADQNLPYGKVMEIMRMLNNANIKSMALITEADE